ncbi:hypothetical protein HDU83_008550 [Entophlyctis luteolus]|nr:hypothetical protein HDU83_008550 [Entophlyctis luteolus]
MQRIHKQLPRTQTEEFRASLQRVEAEWPSLPGRYLRSIFPIATWLPKYQPEWILADFVAGITVGLVAIPQSISYATKLAGLPPQFGLYTSFVGVLLYSLFATSKDVTIGPTAVLSLGVGQAISNYRPGGSVAEITTFAITLSFWTGIIQLAIGLLRFGVIVDFVPIPVIAGFTTGAGIQVIVSQFPALLGIKNISTTDPAYRVLINTGQAITRTSEFDAIFGFSSVAVILLIKFTTDYIFRRFRLNWVKYIGLLKSTIAIIIFTGISYSLRNKSDVSFSITGTIPYGLSGIQQPNTSLSYAGTVFQAIPGILVISVLEHIAVVKTYGRVNGYTTNANQEIVAMGLANALGSLVGSFPATGSFSRSAIKASSGVKSPLGSFITGVLVVVGMFSLTNALYYVPSAVLSAVVVTSVVELVEKGKVAFTLVKVDTIYSSVCYAIVVLLYRVSRPKIEALVRTTDGRWIDPDSDEYSDGKPVPPLSHEVPEGILVVKVDEALIYPNSIYVVDKLKEVVINRYRYTNTLLRKTDRVWSDDTEERSMKQQLRLRIPLPALTAVVFDFSSVNDIDFTGFQTLLDMKDDVARFVGHPVPFHFANVRRRHIRVLLGVPAIPVGTKREVYSEAASAQLKIFSGLGKDAGAQRARDYTALEYFHDSVDEAVVAAMAEMRSGVFGNVV